MPERDGFQVARAIRERERAAGGHLPIIALTAAARSEDRGRCLAAGMDDTVGTELAEGGARLHTIMKMLGHTSTRLVGVTPGQFRTRARIAKKGQVPPRNWRAPPLTVSHEHSESALERD